MATGISKREQQSEDAISANQFFPEIAPLPGDREKAELEYSGKLSAANVIEPVERSFLEVDQKGMRHTSPLLENSFILDDNFYALNELIRSGKKATLFYLDPPYGTGFDFHSRDLEHAYDDKMGHAAYLEFMRRRLILMRECLDDDGSIYVHIGHQMLAHLKVILDEIFGAQNFRNLITRRKCSSKNFTSKQYANINDFVLFYTKGRSYKWNQPGITPEDAWIEKEYPKIDKIGRRYKLVPVHAPGTRNGETGQAWRGKLPPAGKHWQYAPRKLDELDRIGDIHWSKNGNPRRKVYWSKDKKRALTDYWDQYRDAHHQSIKITGYPTEKNLNMVKMIVGASSNAGDLVVDPFCGSGTTLQAARDLDRRFIGVDASFTAAKATLTRMRQGVRRMGDYVSPTVEPLDASSQLSLTDQTDCLFVVDEQLNQAYPDEIEKLASL